MTIVDSINQNPVLIDAYGYLVTEMKRFGAVELEAKKTSIHIKSKKTFAGIHARKDHLVLQIVTAEPIRDSRVFKVEQVSKSRFHNHVKIASRSEVDAKLMGWLMIAYKLMA